MHTVSTAHMGARRRSLRTVFALCLFAALLWWGSHTAAVRETASDYLQPAARGHAIAAAYLVRHTGLDAARDGTLLRHPPTGFAYNVSVGCIHLPTVLLFVLAVICVPVPLRAKLVAVAVGVPLYVALNITRLVHLFHIGVASPRRFSAAHEIGWPLLLATAFLAFWFLWRRWADADPTHPSQPAWAERPQRDPISAATVQLSMEDS
jgi:exosortase/archaeosortase family protein